tara:strand:- start:45 stop:419 length:375 start_codon:yes stop_codon:yes gene_type:complete
MPNRLPTRARLHQIHRWACHTWDTEARLRVEKRLPKYFAGCLGCCEFPDEFPKGLPPLIRVLQTNRSQSADTYLHEFAHVVDAHRNGFSETRKHEGHDAAFRNVAHEVLVRFVYEGGEAESLDF